MNCTECVYAIQSITSNGHHKTCSRSYADLVSATITAAQIRGGAKFEGVVINEHGLKNGWANFPVDFDPIWIDNCIWYESDTPASDDIIALQKSTSEMARDVLKLETNEEITGWLFTTIATLDRLMPYTILASNRSERIDALRAHITSNVTSLTEKK